MMNPCDVEFLTLHAKDPDVSPMRFPVKLVESLTVCDPIMPVQKAIHRLCNGRDLQILKKNGGPKNKDLGNIQPIWVGKYVDRNGTEYILIYEDDLQTIGIDQSFADSDIFDPEKS